MNDQTQVFDIARNIFNMSSGLLRWKPVIERILYKARTLKTFNDITQEIMRGEKYWFDNGKAFAIVQPEVRSMGTIVLIFAAGGSKRAMYEMEHTVIQFARSIDAKQIIALGRKGFMKWQHGTLKATGQQMFMMEL